MKKDYRYQIREKFDFLIAGEDKDSEDFDIKVWQYPNDDINISIPKSEIPAIRETFNQIESEGFDFVEYLKGKGFEKNKGIHYVKTDGIKIAISLIDNLNIKKVFAGNSYKYIFDGSIPQSRYEADTLFKILNLEEQK